MSTRIGFKNVMVIGAAFALIGCGSPTVKTPDGSGGVISGSGGKSVTGSGGQSTGSGGKGGATAGSGGKGGATAGSGGVAGSVLGGSGGVVVTGSGGAVTGAGGGGPCTVAAADPDLISDMEETSATSFFKSGCIVGAWYTTGDGSGTLAPAQGAAFTYDATDCHVGKCAKVTATGFSKNASGSYTYWGWEEGVGLDAPSATVAYPTNAASKSGITFWAKGSAAGNVLVSIATPCTTPKTRTGGGCTPTATEQCDVSFDASISLTTAWTQYSLTWAQFTQPTTWSTYVHCTDKQSAILNINFKHDNSGSGAATSPVLDGSFSIDDLAFTP